VFRARGVSQDLDLPKLKEEGMTKLHKAMRIGAAAAMLALGLAAAATAQEGKVQAAGKEQSEKAKNLPSALAKALSRPANVATTQWADGTVAANLEGTFMNVWIAHVNADGSLSHACVNSAEQAVAALAGEGGLEVK
jgi:hypothetical protein